MLPVYHIFAFICPFLAALSKVNPLSDQPCSWKWCSDLIDRVVIHLFAIGVNEYFVQIPRKE
jgi:hypothetical protein